ncbi:MAG: Phenylalanine--tRNA ligase alpha subunit [Acidimicrobiales bacterium]|nr:MAG: phenylalanine--tRNA ligase subunit alpha [Actinomycetota bacterium]MBV6507103.1 Phenylalanine--tRNA ligase alpha subunit [Acidimicrobiales bacterium]RIK05594.1 MAG: phenylalanine--tRNA ligase subunit alpha [Acidobacteriota bacterium]
MIDDIELSQRQAMERVETATTLEHLREVETEVLGKRSQLSTFKALLRDLEPNERKNVGRAVNAARAEVERAVGERRALLERAERRDQLESERLDLTESLTSYRVGHHHLVTQTTELLEDVFVGMGFTIAEGPEAETDWYNFEALNIPKAHPARSMFDTLYLDLNEPESTVLRTHTSPVQIRVMDATEPPIYTVAPGRVFRRDTADASHMPVFHQIEGLVVDRGITFGDLAGTLESFTTEYFGGSIHSRLRPSYFPFTEPSAEFDINCVFCEGAGCKTCGRTGWLELGGCGLVHPNVFRAVGYDPEVWSGFAFGFGIDRLALMRHGVDDLRELFTNDIRFLEQF